MCENIHAVPVSSYFMFVILVLLTLGLIQYGEPQLSFVRALGGFFGVMQAVWCGGNPTDPVACACPRGMEGDPEPVGVGGLVGHTTPWGSAGGSPGCPKHTAPLRVGLWTWPKRA